MSDSIICMFAYLLPLNIIYVGLVRWEIVVHLVYKIQGALLILNKTLPAYK